MEGDIAEALQRLLLALRTSPTQSVLSRSCGGMTIAGFIRGWRGRDLMSYLMRGRPSLSTFAQLTEPRLRPPLLSFARLFRLDCGLSRQGEQTRNALRQRTPARPALRRLAGARVASAFLALPSGFVSFGSRVSGPCS